MKKFSAKRVFAIIGIVFGSVVAFVGGVVGVMALMGKFKTPVVFPTNLEFLNNGEVVVEKVAYDTSKTWEEQFVDVDVRLRPTIESLMLQGSNPSQEHEVNHKDCLISFVDNVGVDLITLCDEEGKALIPNSNNRYSVQCNEPIYYMINKVAKDYETDGVVKLEAKSINEKALTNEPMVLYVDRAISNVYVIDEAVVAGTNSQTITTGVGLSFDFKYQVNTPLSLKPIYKNGEKEIELYYVATGYSTDYVRVTKEEVDKETSPLHSILTYEEDVFKFEAELAGEHEFILAVFPTYQSKLDYYASVEGMTFANPNYHKVTSEYMKSTSVKVVVNPTDVSEVGLLGANIQLNLYSQKDYITLDGTSGVEGVKDNNLGLYMKRGLGFNAVADYSRFDETTFEGFEWSSDAPKFMTTSRTGEELVWEYTGSVSNISIKKSNVHVGENLALIEYFTLIDDPDANKYYCINGAAAISETDNTIQLLEAGSYLNFYKQKDDGSLKLFNGFDYEVKHVSGTSGQAKSWQIITKSLPEGLGVDETLRIGVLVVNKHGEFKIADYFDSLPVTVSEVELNYDVLNYDFDLNIEFLDGHGIDSDKLSYDEILKVNSGSHSALVLVMKRNPGDSYFVNTINSVVFNINSEEYVLVGNIAADGSFISEVETNLLVTISKDYSKETMYALQLKTGYEESTADVVAKILADPTSANSYILNFYKDKAIVANINWLLNKELLSYTYYESYDEATKEGVETNLKNGNYSVYENTNNHKIVITSSNVYMLKVMMIHYSIGLSNLKVDRYNDNLTINDIKLSLDESELIVTYNVGACLSDENIVINVKFECGEELVDLGGVSILNGSPKNIIFNTGSMDSGALNSIAIQLAESKEIVNTYLKVVVGYAAGEYTYTIKYNDIKLDGSISELFNGLTSIDTTDIGFQDIEGGKNQIIEIKYSATDKRIFNTDNMFNVDNTPLMKNLVEIGGKTILSITIGTTTNFIGIETDVSAFELKTADDKTTFEVKREEFGLDQENIIDDSKTMSVLNFGATTIDMSIDNLVFIDNVKCIKYADGTLVVVGNKYDGWELNKSGEVTPILEIKNGAYGWEFKKTNPHLTLTIEFDVATIAGTKTINLTFASNVSLSVNSVWTEDKILYAGTTVQLLSEDSDYSVFKGSSGLIIKVDDIPVSNTWTIGEEFIREFENKNKIEFYLNGTIIHTFLDFVVRPNVIAIVNEEERFNSETEYSVSQVYSLSSYKTTDGVTGITYGSSATTLYTSDNTQPITNFANFSISPKVSGNSNPELDITSGTLNIGHMSNLNDCVVRTINLIYKSSYHVLASEIEIFNINTINFKVDEFEALTEIAFDDFAEVSSAHDVYTLKDVQADGLLFEVEGGKVKLESSIKEDLTDVELTLLFENEDASKQLVYKAIVKVTHYEPEPKATKDIALSGTTYDLLTGTYSTSTLEADRNVKSLVVTKIVDENRNDITAEVINGPFNPSGYINGEANANCEVVLKEISGPYKHVWIEYTITDRLDKTYSFIEELIIENRQRITKQNPEELEVSSAVYKFISGYEKDGENLSDSKNENAGVFVLSSTAAKPLYYEPVAIYTDSSVTIDFDYDSIKKVQRVNVENRDATLIGEKTLNITLIAYENYVYTEYYASSVNTKYDTNKISLPAAMQGTQGMLVFKIETVSGNFEYYFIYVSCVGAIDGNVNAQNNLRVVAYGSANYPDNYSNKEIAVVDVATHDTYAKFMNKLSTSVDLFAGIEGAQEFKNVFGISRKFTFSLETTSLYLYHAEYAGETIADAFNYNGKQWKKIDVENDLLLQDKHFNTITIGLVYKNQIDYRVTYMYGTITIYLQPTTDVVPNDLSYELPNGEFNKNLEAALTKIDSPFGTDWTASIEKVDGEAYPKYYLTTDEKVKSGKTYYQYDGGVYSALTLTVDTDIKGLNYYEKEENFVVDPTDSSVIKLNKRVAKDTIIEVRYVKNDTVVFVEYTYEATVLPTVSSSEVIGLFSDNTKGFITSIDLEDDSTEYKNNLTYKRYFFGTYSSDYIIKIDGDEIANDGEIAGKVSRDYSKLTFVQTHEQKLISVEIIYSNFGEDDNSREFIFVVNPGFYIEETQGSGSGLTSSESERAVTTASGNYKSLIGSSINVVYTEVLTDALYKFEVKGLTIYTNESSNLLLTFDVENYVINASEDAVLNVGDDLGIAGEEGKKAINFIHSAEDVAINMSISIRTTANKEYVKRNLYLKVVKTYSRLNAIYCEDGAEHENVKSGHTIDVKLGPLHSKLLGEDATLNRVRFELLGVDGTAIDRTNVDLTKMGFTTAATASTVANPNYIEFTVAGNATYIGSSDELQFGSVTRNTMCYVYLNNKAGMEQNSVYYAYQIMAGDSADGLDFTTTSGTVATDYSYVTFLTEDNISSVEYQSENFVIGTMKDTQNLSIFNIKIGDEASLWESDVSYIDAQTDKPLGIGGYLHAIQYKFTQSNYNIYITLDKDTSNVELIVIRPEDEERVPLINFKLTIAGVNGKDSEDKIVNQLTIVIGNYDVRSKFTSNYDTSIYSGYSIDLKTKLTGNSADISAMTYVLESGAYSLGGKQYILTADDTNNDLFKYSDSIIETKAVGEDITVQLWFSVEDGLYKFKTIQYSFIIQLNMQFVVNASDVKNNINNTSPETNFVLTRAIDTDGIAGFAMTVPIISKEDFVKDSTKYKTSDNYFNILVLDLYSRYRQNDEDVTDDELLMPRNNTFTIELYSTDLAYELQKVDAGVYNLIFKKDFFGDVELLLSVKTDNGLYYIIWTVHVSAIKQITYINTNHELARVRKNSLPFNSGDSVKILNSGSADYAALQVKNPAKFADTSQTFEVSYNYKIHELNNQTENITNKKLFTEEHRDSYVGEISTKIKNEDLTTALEISLPSVPVSDEGNQKSYLVTYEIIVEYLNSSYTYYVTYIVTNRQQVQTYAYPVTDGEITTQHSSADIDVTNELTISGDKSYLWLFYMVEQITDTKGNVYRITYQPNSDDAYTNEQFVLGVNGSEGRYLSTADGDSNGIILFDKKSKGEDSVYKYDTRTRKLYIENSGNFEEITKADGKANDIIDTKGDTVAGDIKPVFMSSLNNIYEFKQFIDKYLDIESVLIDDGNSFKLEHQGSGKFSIDLAENLEEGEVLVENELLASLCLVENGIKVVSVPAYSEANTNGFRLTTSGKIEANSSIKLSKMFIPSYFNPTTEGEAEGVTISTPIIGVGTPETTWVSSTGGSLETPITTETIYATITIPDGITYDVKKVEYSVSGGSGSVYELKDSFYYIDATSVTVPDYSGVGIETTYFKVAYVPEETTQTLNLAKAFKVWSMQTVDGKMVLKSSDLASITSIALCKNGVEITDGSVTCSETDKTITCASSTLQDYKNLYPNKKNYELVTATITVGSMSFICNIEFSLPEEVTVS